MAHSFLRFAALLLAAMAAIAGWVTAATATHDLRVLAIVALIVFLAVGHVLLRLAARTRTPPAGRRRHVVHFAWLAAGAAVYVVVAHFAVGRQPQRRLETVEVPAGFQSWILDDGTRLAYVHSPAHGEATAAPVIFLHDGPGMPILPALLETGVRPLDFAADSGFDVYYYDQRGSGLSGRLDLRTADPYSVALHVQDLEQIRTRIGADRIVLAGHGWGATLAVNYLLAHAANVSKLVLLSPAPLWYPRYPDFVDAAARARITDVDASALALLERPTLRLLVGRLTAATSTRAAHTLVNDWEADQWWTDAASRALQLGQPRLTCRSDPTWGLPPLAGLGFFAYSYTVASALALPDPTTTLSEIRTPTLVTRGLCDYVVGRVAQDYLDALPGAVYVASPGAGHFIWLEQAALLQRVLSAFLLDRDVPLVFYTPRRSPGT